MPKILILGSGMVAPPCVEYLSRRLENEITIEKKYIPISCSVTCRTLSAAHALTSSYPRCTSLALDVSSTADLDAAIAAHDLVISLIPYAYHAAVIKSAIKSGKNVVTTSYVSSAMRDLEAEVRDAGIVVMNEVGVDPGVDHLYAIKTIGDVHAKGGKVKEFYSYCGGLPAPECSNNPLGFKFSWSPRGALLSQRNSASYLLKNQIINISDKDLMASAKPYHVVEGYDFVAYPNRNSVPFREFYGIPEAETVVRGSLRYERNPMFVQALADLGWLEMGRKEWLKEGMTWAEIQQKTISAMASDENSLISRIKEVCNFPNSAESERIISGLRWIGLLSSEKAIIRGGNLLDTLCGQLEKLMSFQPGERDLVMLQHKFVIEWSDGSKETRTSTLELLSDPNRFSAMALSVGVTCGIATQLVLDRHPAFVASGIWAPYTKEICDPIREAVEKEAVRMVERTL